MIYTFTLNPAVDYFLTISGELMVDEVNRGTDEIYKAGGKGLNVSKILSVLGIPSNAVAILGGFTGDFIREQFSSSQYTRIIPVPVCGTNRINLKAHHDNKALCINGQGPTADSNTVDAIRRIVSSMTGDDTAVISGSMMLGLDSEFLLDLSDRIHRAGAKLVIDMEKVTPELIGRCRPYLIKPNLYELQLLMDDPGITMETAAEPLEKLRQLGVENILLSLGKDGALLADEQGLLKLDHPSTPLVNKVGAGDSMLGAFIGKLTAGSTREEALRYGGAAGNAAASTMEDVTLDIIERFLPLMSTRIWK